jgi:hypothetical protein
MWMAKFPKKQNKEQLSKQEFCNCNKNASRPLTKEAFISGEIKFKLDYACVNCGSINKSVFISHDGSVVSESYY